jgi:hypothetical protein
MRLLQKLRFSFRTMTPEDYLFNQRGASLTREPHVKTLQILMNANQGTETSDDEIQLIGVPKG